MKYGIGFCIEKRKGNKNPDVPILMNISFNKKYHRYYTGERCAPKQWIDERTKDGERVQKVGRNVITPKGETAANINRHLDGLRNEVIKYFSNCEALRVAPSYDELKKALDIFSGKEPVFVETIGTGFFDRYDQYRKNSTFSEIRKRQLKVSRKKLIIFQPETTFENIDTQYLTDYKNHLIKNGLSRNSVTREMKIFRAFLSHANKMGWTNNYPFLKFSIEPETYGDPVYITIDERDLLFNAEIKEPHLQRVRDIFVFQCLVGCRVGDLLKLKKSNIVDGCIEYIAGKTKDNEPRVARVPLTKKALDILSKYDLPGDELLPFISSQKYNDYIKDLFRAVDLNRIVTIKDPKTRTGKQVKISDIASSHMARRVFVGGLYQKGVKNEIIASMSGHVQDSKSFNRYYRIERESQQDAIKMIE